MSHPAKKVFFGSFVAVCLLGSAWGQAITQAVRLNMGNAASGFTFNKFDTSLGQLSGITITINFSTPTGSFTIINADEEVAAAVTGATASINFTNSALGFTYQNSTPVNVTPSLPNVIGVGGQQQFSIVSGQSLLSGGTPVTNTVGTNFWSAYEGVGTLSIIGSRQLSPSVDGADAFTVLRAATLYDTQLTLTYTYSGAEPIPEPSTVAAGAFLTLVAAASYWRRRRNASAPKN